MKKLLIIIALLLPAFVMGQTSIDRAMSVWARNIVNANFTESYTNIATNAAGVALKAPIASPTFTGTVTVPILSATDDVSFDSTLTVGLGATFGDDVTMDSTLSVLGISHTPTVVEYTTIATIDSTKIVGTSAGDIGHVDGAILVAAPASGYVLEFVSAMFIYDYATAAFAGGADDIVVQVGGSGTQVTVSGAITGANLLEAAGDKILQLGATATELLPGVGSAISIAGTALTNNGGTAAGLLRVHVTYRKHTTGL